MISKPVLVVAVFLTIGMRSAAVAAAGLDEVHDTQCLAVAGLMLNDSGSGLSEAGLIGAMFYMGKLFGRDPNYDMVAAMKPVVETMTEASVKTVAAECSAELALRSKQMAEAGAALKALGL